MKITAQTREKNTVSLEIEADHSDFKKSFEKAMLEAGKEIRIPGFRPGKAPRHILESSLNLEAVEHRAAQDLIAELYPAIITESKIDPVDYPSVEIVQQEKDKPFIFKLAIEVYPEVKLGKYKGIRLNKRSAEVAEAEVLAALGRLQERVSVAGPDGQKELLPLDDEFAKKVSKFGTLAELKTEVQKALHEEKLAESDGDLRNQAIAAAGAEAKVEIPQAMIEREIDIMLDELKTSLAQSGLTLEQYLQGAQKEAKALRDELKNSAEIRVKGKLVLNAIAAAEKIEITPEDMTAEITAMAAEYGQEAAAAERQLNETGRAYVKDYLLRKKSLDWLIGQASIKEIKAEEAKS
jgi:FKBP-type peptidyl-prolyl cis-trans isomerase (trigger factor)